jgi:hypothetical protein
MHCPLYNIHRQQLVDSFNKHSIEFTIQTILYGSETSDYNQNVKLFRAVHASIIPHLTVYDIFFSVTYVKIFRRGFCTRVQSCLDILREGLDFVEAGRPFQSRNVQGMKLLLYETVLQKGSLKLSPDICCRRL